jgi:adenine-specific DNA-methyltransferase
MSRDESDMAQGDMSDLGERYTRNRKDHNRYHANWLNMMYPRLRVAKDLLRDDGVIFIHIDDNEVHNLRKICDEVFGERNFGVNFVWNTEGNTDNQYVIKVKHEHILCYYRNALNKDVAIGKVIDPNTPENSNLRKGFADNNINKNNPANPPVTVELPIGFPCTEEKMVYRAKALDDDFFRISKEEKYISDSLKKEYNIENLSGLPVKMDDMVVENYKLIKPCRIYVGMANRDKLEAFIKNNLEPISENDSPIEFYINSNAAVRYRKINEKPRNILSVLRNLGTTEKNKTYLKRMEIYFDYPKPIQLLKYLVLIGSTNKNDIVLDFFSGSSATAHATMQLNAEDGGNRKYIMVQLPEPCDENSEAFKAGYKNICEIGKERIRRAGEKILEENKDKDGIENLDTGFKVFRVADTNINWLHQDLKGYDLFDHYDKNASDKDKLDFMPGFTDLDVVYEIMLRQTDIPLSSKVVQLSDIGSHTYMFADSFVVCLEQAITRELVNRLAAIEPLPVKFVFRDSAFDDNIALKDETFRRLNALIEKNSGGEKPAYTVEFI